MVECYNALRGDCIIRVSVMLVAGSWYIIKPKYQRGAFARKARVKNGLARDVISIALKVANLWKPKVSNCVIGASRDFLSGD